jgi:uncharacterized protein (TIGR03067 family)
MKQFVLTLHLLLAIGTAAAAPAPFARPDRPDRRPDLERLQGDWELIRVVGRNGRVTELKQGDRLVLSFSGRRAVFGDPRRPTRSEEWVVTLDASSAPKKMDLNYSEERLEKAPYLRDMTGLCIYRLQGDTLTIRLGGGDSKEGRPANFESPAGGDTSDPDVCMYRRKSRSGR